VIWKYVLQCYKLGKTESECMFYPLHVALTCATAGAQSRGLRVERAWARPLQPLHAILEVGFSIFIAELESAK
jgi:hypothetical protein